MFSLRLFRHTENILTYVVTREVVDRGLGEHGVVLELRLAQRGRVAGNNDELGLARPQCLQRGTVSESDWDLC